MSSTENVQARTSELAAASVMRRDMAIHAGLPVEEIRRAVWRAAGGPTQAVRDAADVLPATNSKRIEAERFQASIRERRDQLAAEQRALAGLPATDNARWRADQVRQQVERYSDAERVLAAALAAPWPTDDAVRAGVLAVCRVAVSDEADVLVNRLEQALQPLRAAAGALLSIVQRFEEIRATAQGATGQSTASWAWSADDVALLRRAASMSALRTETRQPAEVAA